MKKVRFEKKKYTYLDSLGFSIISSPVCTVLYLILSLAGCNTQWAMHLL